MWRREWIFDSKFEAPTSNGGGRAGVLVGLRNARTCVLQGLEGEGLQTRVYACPQMGLCGLWSEPEGVLGCLTSYPHLGHVPVTKRSARNLPAASEYSCCISCCTSCPRDCSDLREEAGRQGGLHS